MICLSNACLNLDQESFVDASFEMELEFRVVPSDPFDTCSALVNLSTRFRVS